MAAAAPIRAQLSPQPRDRNDYTVAVPNTSNLVARVWDGGMASYRHLCTPASATPVNFPRGRGLSLTSGVPGAFAVGGQLGLWENAFGFRGVQISSGEGGKVDDPGGIAHYLPEARPPFTVPTR